MTESERVELQSREQMVRAAAAAVHQTCGTLLRESSPPSFAVRLSEVAHELAARILALKEGGAGTGGEPAALSHTQGRHP